MRALFPGRFQPFHKGHLKLVKKILERNDEVVIAVANAQFNYLVRNPFTAGERIWMIHEALKEEGVEMKKCYITSLQNDPNNARWVGHLKSLVPPFDVVYTRNPLAIQLLQDAGVKVKIPGFYNRDQYSSTKIREKMLRNEDWESTIPPATVRIIKKLDGIERMKSIANAEASSAITSRKY